MEELTCNQHTYKKWRDVIDQECVKNGQEPGRGARLTPDDLGRFLTEGEGKIFRTLHKENSDRTIYSLLVEAGKAKPLSRDQLLRIVFGLSGEKLEVAEDLISLAVDETEALTREDLLRKLPEDKAEEYLAQQDLAENGVTSLRQLWKSLLGC